MTHDPLAPSLPTAATATPAVTLRTTAPAPTAHGRSAAGCRVLGAT